MDDHWPSADLLLERAPEKIAGLRVSKGDFQDHFPAHVPVPNGKRETRAGCGPLMRSERNVPPVGPSSPDRSACSAVEWLPI